MRRSKGLAESTEVYSAENHFFADNSSGSGTPQGPKRTFYRWSRARLLHSSQLGFAVIIDLLRVRIKGLELNTNTSARPHG